MGRVPCADYFTVSENLLYSITPPTPAASIASMGETGSVHGGWANDCNVSHPPFKCCVPLIESCSTSATIYSAVF